jgi:hypothetical protein
VIVSEAVRPYTNEPVYDEWAPHLLNAGYRLTLFDGINAWFVREESNRLIPLASIPVNQLDYFRAYDQEKIDLLKRVSDLEATLAGLQAAPSSPAPGTSVSSTPNRPTGGAPFSADLSTVLLSGAALLAFATRRPSGS